MKFNKTSTIGAIIITIILIIIIILSNVINADISFLESNIGKVFLPIQNAIVLLKYKVSGNMEAINELDKMKDQNKKQKKQIEELKEIEREYEIIKKENNLLKDYLDLKEKYTNYNTVPANIIEKSFSNYDKIFIINIGEKEGIKKGMSVISREGLVGHILSVNNKTAKVQTIIDTAGTVSGIIANSEEHVLLRGMLNTNKEIKATNIQTEATILQGDEVITSGLGGIYPKGILIGNIKEVINTKNPIDRYATVKLATNFNKIENVLVIKK